MQRRKKTRSAKNPAGDGESGNEDSAASGDQQNLRPSGDAVVAGAERASSCRQQAPCGHAVNVRTRHGQLLAQLAQLRSLVQQVADERVWVQNLKNEMLTLQDENVQLQMALNRELQKTETLWNEMEERKRPPGMSPPRPVTRPPLHHAGHSQHGAHPAPPAALPFYMDDVINADVERNASAFHPLIMPWNVNENDVLDLGDFEDDLQQYISYRGSSPIENYIDGYGALPSHLSFGGAVEALGTNPPIHAQRFQWQDEHRQRQQTERQQQQEHGQIEQSEQEQQVAEGQAPRQQRQRFLLQQQRSLFGYRRTRRQDQSEAALAAATNENHDAEQEKRAGRDRRSQGDGVTESNRRRGSNAKNLEYEQLPLD